MIETEPLFDIDTATPFACGDRVVAHTIWGNEPGWVIGLVEREVKVRIDRRGLVLLMSTTRLSHEENVR